MTQTELDFVVPHDKLWSFYKTLADAINPLISYNPDPETNAQIVIEKKNIALRNVSHAIIEGMTGHNEWSAFRRMEGVVLKDQESD